LYKIFIERHTINSTPRFATDIRTVEAEGYLLLAATCSSPCHHTRVDLMAGSLFLLVVVIVVIVVVAGSLL
jgi:hypothetical protein